MDHRDESEGERKTRGAHVRARGLTRHFGDHVALDRLDLDIESGETFALLGANGAGKTTFIRLVTGYLVPNSGRVEVDGFCPADDPRPVHEKLGYVAETSRLYPELRVRSFLRFSGGVHGLAGAPLERAIERALADFSLESVATRLVGNLSKGFAQRVSLAQGFLHDPQLLIVDEPTSGLDPLHRAEVREILGRLGSERTVLLCTHDLAEARELCTRAAVLFQGKLIRCGATAEVLDAEDSLALFRGEGERRGEAL